MNKYTNLMNKNLNILFLSDTGFNPPGGAERYSNIVTSAMKKLGLNVLKASIISNGALLKFSTSSGIVRCFYNPLLEKEMKALLRKFKVDVAHLNILHPPHALICMRVLHDLKIPYIATVHSYLHICPTEYFVKLPELMPCKNPYLNLHCVKCVIAKAKLPYSSKTIFRYIGQMFYNMHVLKLFLKKASYVISPSLTYTELLRKYGVNAVHIWHPIKCSPTTIEYYEGNTNITFVGRLSWEKGIHVLLKLAKKLNYANVHIIGKGELYKWLLRHKPSNVVIHGFVSDLEKINFMTKSSVVVVPSIWNDLFNYVVSESLSLARPVVAFNLGGPKEQIESSGGGLLAKPFDTNDFILKTAYLLENPNEGKRMGLNGKRWVKENLDPENYVNMLIKIYNNAIHRGR